MAKKQKQDKKVFADHLIGHEGVIITHLGVAVDIRLDNGEVHTVRVKRRSGHVVGDEVTVEVTGLKQHERRTELKRIDAGFRKRIVAANLDCVGIISSPSPYPPRGFVDRAVIAANAADIEPFIVVNKSDLPGAQELCDEYNRIYQGRVKVFLVSAENGDSINLITDFFAEGHRGVFVGDSGVGKSSLLNRICPELQLRVGEINERLELGRHTTTASTLVPLQTGGEIIDTPGFKDFGVVDVPVEELAYCIPEFLPYLIEPCKFNNCRHVSEPGCNILAALQEGLIIPERHDAYKLVLSELLDTESRERGY